MSNKETCLLAEQEGVICFLLNKKTYIAKIKLLSKLLVRVAPGSFSQADVFGDSWNDRTLARMST